MPFTMDDTLKVQRRRNRKTWTLEIYRVVSAEEYERTRSAHNLDDADPIRPIELTSEEIEHFFGILEEKDVRAEITTKAGYKSYMHFVVPSMLHIPHP